MTNELSQLRVAVEPGIKERLFLATCEPAVDIADHPSSRAVAEIAWSNSLSTDMVSLSASIKTASLVPSDAAIDEFAPDVEIARYNNRP